MHNFSIERFHIRRNCRMRFYGCKITAFFLMNYHKNRIFSKIPNYWYFSFPKFTVPLHPETFINHKKE